MPAMADMKNSDKYTSMNLLFLKKGDSWFFPDKFIAISSKFYMTGINFFNMLT